MVIYLRLFLNFYKHIISLDYKKIAKGFGISVITRDIFPLLVVLTYQATEKTLYQCFQRKLI